MSPEQLRGLAPEPGWDLWALAVIAYEMVASAHPFAGAMRTQVDFSTRRVASVRAHLGADADRWDAFFARALAPGAHDRPASARALLVAFGEALQGENGLV